MNGSCQTDVKKSDCADNTVRGENFLRCFCVIEKTRKILQILIFIPVFYVWNIPNRRNGTLFVINRQSVSVRPFSSVLLLL